MGTVCTSATSVAASSSKSCVLYVLQGDCEVARSFDARSYEPVFDLKVEIDPTQRVTLCVALGGSAIKDARDLLPPRERVSGSLFEARLDPHDFEDEAATDVALVQTVPKVDGVWNAACARLRVDHHDAFSATLHVVGAHNLPRRGVSWQVHRHLTGVFALLMQLSAETFGSARALTADFAKQQRALEEARHRALNPSWQDFLVNRTAVIEVQVSALDFLRPEALALSLDAAMAVARGSSCSRSTSEEDGASADGGGASSAECSRSTSEGSSEVASSSGCSRSTSESGAASDSGRSGSSESNQSKSSGECSGSTSESGAATSDSGRSGSSGECSRSSSGC